jgi:hypothetical protein
MDRASPGYTGSQFARDGGASYSSGEPGESQVRNAYYPLFNIYLEDVGGYGNHSRGKAFMAMENVVFRSANNPEAR